MAATVCWEMSLFDSGQMGKKVDYYCPCFVTKFAGVTWAVGSLPMTAEMNCRTSERLTTNWVVGAAPGEPPGASSGSHLCWPSPALEDS
mgnify:CR=1 FL=1